MGTFYSHYKSGLKHIAKKSKLSIKEVIEKYQKYIDNYTGGINEKAIYNIDLLVEKMYLSQDGKNIYIKNTNLISWLKNQPIKINLTVFDILPSINKVFFIHHKLKNINSIAYSIIVNDKNNTIQISNRIYSNHESIPTFFCIIPFDIQLNEINILNNSKVVGNLFTNKDIIPELRFIFNLFFYMKCFPDYIIDGVPDDFRENILCKVNKKNCFHIEPHESIIDHSGVTPHFRQGHFMKLESDRYVNKQHQIIWRSSAMVKGFKAKTVIE